MLFSAVSPSRLRGLKGTILAMVARALWPRRRRVVGAKRTMMALGKGGAYMQRAIRWCVCVCVCVFVCVCVCVYVCVCVQGNVTRAAQDATSKGQGRGSKKGPGNSGVHGGGAKGVGASKLAMSAGSRLGRRASVVCPTH